MQSTLWEMLGWMKHKLQSRLPEEISITSDMHPYGRKWRRAKEILDESERGEWKSWLKAQHSENEDYGIRSHNFIANRWGIDGDTVETMADFILGGSKITADGDCSHEIKRCLLLGRKIMTNLDSILKSRDNKGPSSQSYGFSRVTELNWTECQDEIQHVWRSKER